MWRTTRIRVTKILASVESKSNMHESKLEIESHTKFLRAHKITFGTTHKLNHTHKLRSGTMWSVAPVSAMAKCKGVPLLVVEMTVIKDRIRMGGRTMSSTN